MRIRMTKPATVQQAREESFERIMNDATKAAQRNLNVLMRDKCYPGDEVDVSKSFQESKKSTPINY